MKKFGLIGYPISHSLSPALFKAAYNGKYIYDLIEIEDFETAYQKFLDEYAVINVTAPFKEPAFKKADIVSEECRAIGATNILMKREDGKIVASQIVDTNGSGHGALAGVLTALRADVLICGGIGGGAQMALAAAGIQLYGGVSGNADAAVEALVTGNLTYNPNVRCNHHGEHHHHEEGHNCGIHGCGSHGCH